MIIVISNQKLGVPILPTFLLGILNDDLTLTAMMHKYDGLAFWDYATAAPYVKIDMNPGIEQDDLNLCEKAQYIYITTASS